MSEARLARANSCSGESKIALERCPYDPEGCIRLHPEQSCTRLSVLSEATGAG